MNEFSTNFICLVSLFSALGTSALLALYWQFQKSKIDMLKSQTFKTVQDQVDALDKILLKINGEYNSKIKELQAKNQSSQNVEINRKKIDILNQIVTLSHQIRNIDGLILSKDARKINSKIRNMGEIELKKAIVDLSSRLKEEW